MKIKSNSVQKFGMIAITALFFLSGMAGTLLAHDGDWDKNHHYYIDKHGYWDEGDHYRKFVFRHGHHGYWDTRGRGERVWIVID